MAANALIRLNSTATRGLGSIVLDAATNISATVTYNDWVVSDSAGTIRPVMPGKLGKATVTGLPPMLQIAYFQVQQTNKQTSLQYVGIRERKSTPTTLLCVCMANVYEARAIWMTSSRLPPVYALCNPREPRDGAFVPRSVC